MKKNVLIEIWSKILPRKIEKKKAFHRASIIFFSTMLVFLLTSCGKKEEVKSANMQQIYKKQGIPVKIEKVMPQVFKKVLIYNARLTGNRQSLASAMMGGRIEKIYVSVGEKVTKDQLLMEFPQNAPSSQYKQAKAAYELSQKTVERMSNLYEQGGISKQQLDQVRTKYDVDEANWDAVQQVVKVFAPISGIVTNINVNETDNVKCESVLATISDMSKVKGTVWATEDESTQIREGMPAIAHYKDLTLKGKVSQIAMSMSSRYNAFRVELVFDNPQLRYKSGIMSEIQIDTFKNPLAIVVAREQVQKDKNGTFVFTVKGNKAKKQYITIGKQDNNFEITHGLELGDELIVEGLNLVKDGNKVKVIK
ncbi:MAG: efflux RND transporter periplasmic adaptor subunit [Candidatus Cloacimonadota bacterium]|nr:efflux RND transporter periplasmic adaptor subunit [Candidatus Cloacimonadota bacterium]